MKTFPALRIHQHDGGTQPRLEQLTLDDLSEGEVVIRGEYSSINYKDALAGTGKGRILRRFPLVFGVDVAGTVETSSDRRFRAGDKVVVTGCGLSETHDGGFAGYTRARADCVTRLPDGLDARSAMAIGTAGFTAALAIHRLEQVGQRPALGPIAVTGATGGVGSMAIAMLAGIGYAVTAVTRKSSADDYLRQLGASDILHTSSAELPSKPLEKAIWGGAVDNVGGELLGWLTRTTVPWGSIASIGLAGGAELHTTVMPFILRGVSILGINSVEVSPELRADIWRRLAGDLKPQHLDRIAAREVSLDGVLAELPAYVEGRITGRCIVRLG
jgi:NADPH2:quinone reductase